MKSELRLGARGPNELVLLHGFSGSPEDWREVMESADGSAFAPALPGHHRDAPVPCDFEDAVQQTLARIPSPHFDVVGYSLGGRLALGMAATAPDRVGRLFLIAAHCGLSDLAAREARRTRDRELARLLERSPEVFFSDWDRQPLFEGNPSGSLQAWKHRRAQHHPRALAETLERLSLGGMPDLTSTLMNRQPSSTLCVGERDLKYVERYGELAARRPELTLHLVEGASHRVLIDRPRALGRLLAHWIDRSRDERSRGQDRDHRGMPARTTTTDE